MTEISFHFNVPSRTGYACRLLRKAQRQGMALAVTGPADVLSELDRELWTFGAAEFVPHHAGSSGPPRCPRRCTRRTVWLGANPLDAPRARRARSTSARGAAAASRPSSASSRSSPPTTPTAHAARERWKAYARRGYPIKRHEVAA